MFDARIRDLIEPPLGHMAQFLTRRGINNANTVTILGFGFALCSFGALAFGFYGVALLFIVLNRLLDGLDGAVARLLQATDLGGFYDIISDFIFYSGAVFFFAVGRPDMALSAAFLIFSFVGSGSAFLAYAILAAKRGVNHEKQGKKAFFYVAGLAEGAETFAALLLMAAFPDAFSWIAGIFGTLCWMTALGRVIQASRDFGPERN